LNEDFVRSKEHRRMVSSIQYKCRDLHHLTLRKTKEIGSDKRKNVVVLQVICSTGQLGLQRRIAVATKIFFGNCEYSISSEQKSIS